MRTFAQGRVALAQYKENALEGRDFARRLPCGRVH